MNNSQNIPSRSTVNGHKYTDGAKATATVRLAACNGLPVAFRSVEVMNAGSFATSRVQSVTAGGITELSSSEAERLVEEATMPLN